MTTVLTTLPQVAEKPVDVFILLDRSGSMQGRMEGALKAINAFVADLASDPVTRTAAVSLFSFDVGPLVLVRDHQRVDLWQPVLLNEVHPRGCTALFDAIRYVSGVIEATPLGGKTVLVIQTDGLENASTNTTKEEARNCISRLQERGVQVLFLGADFDASPDAQTVGVAYSSTIMGSGAAGLRTVFGAIARETKAFASGAVTSMAFSEADREAARLSEATPNSQSATSDWDWGTDGGLAPPLVGFQTPFLTYGRNAERAEEAEMTTTMDRDRIAKKFYGFETDAQWRAFRDVELEWSNGDGRRAALGLLSDVQEILDIEAKREIRDPTQCSRARGEETHAEFERCRLLINRAKELMLA